MDEVMANHKSAKKRILRNESKSKINSSRISRVRTFIKKIEKEIDNKDIDKANLLFKETMPEIHRSVSKGLIHKKTAARKLSRLSKKIKFI